MNGIHYILVLTFLLAQSQLLIAGKKLPDWVLNPVSDTDSTLYGVGQGSSHANAKQSALESIAGKLLTEIESTLTVNTQSSNDKVMENVSGSIKSQIANTNLSGHEVDRVKKVKKVYWAQVSIPKKVLYETTWNEFRDLMNGLNQQFSSLSEQSVLEVYGDREGTYETLKKARSKLMIARAVNSQVDYSRYSNQLTVFGVKLEKKLNRFIIYVTSNPEMSELAKRLANQLSIEDIPAVLSTPQYRAPKLKIDGKFKEQIMLNQKNVVSRLTVELIDEFSNTLSTREFNIRGSSLTSHESAKTVAINRFVKDLELEGINEAFGLFD